MENIKSKIIPKELKNHIDEILELQLFNANRYYAESNPKIKVLMESQLSEMPEVFYDRLCRRWEWHNEFYETLLEPAYLSFLSAKEIELSPGEIDDLIAVYNTICLVDEATLVMSGAIKKYLDYVCSKVSVVDENIPTNEAAFMLVTPPVNTFFAQYIIDHLFYIYLQKVEIEKAEKFKKNLMKKYHANDEIIFNSRFEKKFKNYLELSADEILKKIDGFSINAQYQIKHFYFTLEHPDRKAIRDIIIYDNLNEKIIASNLIGISGFLFRRKILEYLNSNGVLKNNGYIYEFSNEVIIRSLELLKMERGIKMEKNINVYKQRGDTCAVACLMMVLEYFGIIEKANWYEERRLFRIYGSKYMSGTPFSAIAYHLSKNGLKTSIYHSNPKLFNNDKKELSEDVFQSSMKEYEEHLQRAQLKGTKVVNGIDINAKLIKEKIQNGEIIILAGEINGVYHAILLSGYDKDKFIVCDPLYKSKQIKNEEELNDFMNTGIGKWFISVNGRKKETEKLLQSLDKFNEEAKKMLDFRVEKGRSYVKK